MTTGYNQCGRTPVDGKKSINPLSLNNLEGDCYTLNICVSPSNSYVEVLTPSMLVLGGGSFPGGSDGEEPAYNAGDLGLIPGSGRSPGEGNGYAFQYSFLENSMGRGGWWAMVRRVTKSWTWLSHQCTHTHTLAKWLGYECGTPRNGISALIKEAPGSNLISSAMWGHSEKTAVYELGVKVAQSCLTLCHPIGCSPPDSSVHGILQARILEWIAISYSRGSSWPRDQIQPRDRTQVPCNASRLFTIWAARGAHELGSGLLSDTKLAGVMILGFPGLRTVRNNYLSFISHSLW